MCSRIAEHGQDEATALLRYLAVLPPYDNLDKAASGPLLPARAPNTPHRKTLVLDLDNTLIFNIHNCHDNQVCNAQRRSWTVCLDQVWNAEHHSWTVCLGVCLFGGMYGCMSGQYV
jgi:hypothetical protein